MDWSWFNPMAAKAIWPEPHNFSLWSFEKAEGSDSVSHTGDQVMTNSAEAEQNWATFGTSGVLREARSEMKRLDTFCHPMFFERNLNEAGSFIS
jgi:hypothetical protein